MQAAVKGILESAVNGVSFVQLVRDLREKGFDPSRYEVQTELRALDTKLREKGDKLELRAGQHITIVDASGDFEYTFVVAVVKTENLRALLDDKDEPDFNSEEIEVLGRFELEEEAYRCATTNLFGESETGVRAVFRYLVPEPQEDEDAELPLSIWELYYVQLGAATMVQPVMPPAEPKPREVTLQDYVNAEMVSIEEAVHGALDEDIYKQLRAEANKKEEKLSLSIKVDIDTYKHIVNAQMSGAIKLKASHQTLIEDPAQMKLNLA